MKAIYRSYDHGLTYEAWDKICRGKGPTLIVIKSEYGLVFGGFTS